jgi:hypothetical protein
MEMRDIDNSKKSDSYEFTISKDQHPGTIPSLQSSVVQAHNLTDIINKEEAQKIISNFQISGKEPEAIVKDIPSRGIILDEFLKKIAQEGYKWQNVQDFNRGLPTITIKGEEVKIFDKASGRFQGKDGTEVMNWNTQKFSDKPEEIKGNAREFQSLETFTDLLQNRGISNSDLVMTMFNQNTLKGFIGDAFVMRGPYGISGNPSLDQIELLVENGMVVGFNLTGQYIIGEKGVASTPENTINFNTAIKLSQPSHVLGACEVQSINSTFAATGEMGKRFLKEMQYNIEHQVDTVQLMAKADNLGFTIDQLNDYSREFMEGKSSDLIEQILKKEEELIARAQKVGIPKQEVGEALINFGAGEELLGKIADEEKRLGISASKEPSSRGLVGIIKQFFVNLLTAIKSIFSSSKEQSEAANQSANQGQQKVQPNIENSKSKQQTPIDHPQETPQHAEVKKKSPLESNRESSAKKVTDATLPSFPPTFNVTTKGKESGQGRN